mmetsp:Transcript_176740/g.566878  ORF Transcript_176740/g.566878 Transcript_176740/m.566878 type:complete len:264 (+) Transcript_176740:98-889(+)
MAESIEINGLTSSPLVATPQSQMLPKEPTLECDGPQPTPKRGLLPDLRLHGLEGRTEKATFASPSLPRISAVKESKRELPWSLPCVHFLRSPSTHAFRRWRRLICRRFLRLCTAGRAIISSVNSSPAANRLGIRRALKIRLWCRLSSPGSRVICLRSPPIRMILKRRSFQLGFLSQERIFSQLDSADSTRIGQLRPPMAGVLRTVGRRRSRQTRLVGCRWLPIGAPQGGAEQAALHAVLCRAPVSRRTPRTHGIPCARVPGVV